MFWFDEGVLDLMQESGMWLILCRCFDLMKVCSIWVQLVRVDPRVDCSNAEQVFVTVVTWRSVTVFFCSISESHVVYMRAQMQVFRNRKHKVLRCWFIHAKKHVWTVPQYKWAKEKKLWVTVAKPTTASLRTRDHVSRCRVVVVFLGPGSVVDVAPCWVVIVLLVWSVVEVALVV